MPQKGNKERLVETAAQNASMVLIKDSEKIKREEENGGGCEGTGTNIRS